jgi:hypothetical protein
MARTPPRKSSAKSTNSTANGGETHQQVGARQAATAYLEGVTELEKGSS